MLVRSSQGSAARAEKNPRKELQALLADSDGRINPENVLGSLSFDAFSAVRNYSNSRVLRSEGHEGCQKP